MDPSPSSPAPRGRARHGMACMVGLALLLAGAAPAAAGPPVHIDGRSTAKVCQVLGEFDRQIGAPTVNATESQAKFWGADLGTSFEHDGRLFVLFGDTHPVPGLIERPRDADSIAVSDTRDPESCLRLEFLKDPDGGFRPVTIPGVYAGAFAVPTGGFSLNGAMYVLVSSDTPERGPAGRSVLARSDDSGWTFRPLFDLSRDKLVNVSPVVEPEGRVAGLPEHRGAGILLFGTSGYRRSDPHLAFLPADAVEDRSALRFFAGMDRAANRPRWTAEEAEAVPLFNHGCVGEFSAAWNPFLDKWLLLYTCGAPRASTFLRTADDPWGPWSPPEVLFDPARDEGQCGFLNPVPVADAGRRGCPVVSDPHTPFNPGESYGPYVINRFTQGERGRWSTIYYLMSTWNPYTVVLMRSTLHVGAEGQAALAPPPPPPRPPARPQPFQTGRP
ncbi:DUF4185 domain-containing protein [Antarcticirhabdus aurantiaca]|uniref:DUF4185 domain-containing protein n=1 Tax=Antarcticirhabdus aurantiaca TaxID=2606717 RepID=A0ACD4NQU7_9HYPH|nr:DUF4185 domain-containing protein [Antarcticirhabdus aurantiaca]WAJ29243.1 DUF4185 domain-containing protein [Jeongeuplla avenae]